MFHGPAIENFGYLNTFPLKRPMHPPVRSADYKAAKLIRGHGLKLPTRLQELKILYETLISEDHGQKNFLFIKQEGSKFTISLGNPHFF